MAKPARKKNWGMGGGGGGYPDNWINYKSLFEPISVEKEGPHFQAESKTTTIKEKKTKKIDNLKFLKYISDWITIPKLNNLCQRKKNQCQ